MQNVSQLWEQIESGEHWTEVKVAITGETYGMDKIISLRTGRAAFGSGNPSIGLAPAGSLEMAMRDVSVVSIPRMAKVEPFIRVCNSSQQSEWLPKGVYYLDRRAITTGDILELEAYDTMLKADQFLNLENIALPLLDITLVEMIASVMWPDGPRIDPRTYELMDQGFEIPVPEPEEFTGRQMLSYIAALYGGSFIVNDQDMLQLICLWDKPEETNFLLIDPDGAGRVLIGGDRIILT